MEDVIITALAIVLGLGFKFIEKRLKTAGKMKEYQVETTEIQEDPEQPEPVPEPAPAFKPAPVRPVPVRKPRPEPKPKAKPAEVTLKTKERIDPKKLVIYSEIMKPKYRTETE